MKLTDLKGIGPKTEKLFQKLGVYTPSDLLYYFPRTYEVYEELTHLAELRQGEKAAVSGILERDASVVRVHGVPLTTAYIRDGSGRLRLNWFHAPYLRQMLKAGMRFTFRGPVTRGRNGLGMNQPQIYKTEIYREKIGTMDPVYAQTKGLSNQSIMKAVHQVLESERCEPEFLPPEILYNRALPGMQEALQRIHFPGNKENFLKARRRMAYNELFLFSLALLRQKEAAEEQVSEFQVFSHEEVCLFEKNLPYSLTKGQKAALQDIRNDMASGTVMNRLLQGDVGSGKTIVALLAMLEVCAEGGQAAFMAPTEVLARQHYEKLCEILKKQNMEIRILLITGSMSAKEKKEAYRKISEHEADLIIGTHALIQEKVIFHRLMLVITDEQHRFGVNQRKLLGDKGHRPHVLVMSATPIPRTLAMLLYADMQVSRITELPSNRIPIKSCVVDEGYRPKAYRFLTDEIRKGRQAYVICPMVEANEMMDLTDVVSYADILSRELPSDIRIGILHGRMKAGEKDAVMHAFQTGKIDVLVATTVIEVGVDVPNASVILIENAERFGLAQLHQLRGRVGRSGYQSYCILIDTQNSEKSRERLGILTRSNDGFWIANEDLRLRGPGDIFGIRQSGELEFSVADLYQDGELLREAAEDAEYLLRADKELIQAGHIKLKEKLECYIEKSCTL